MSNDGRDKEPKVGVPFNRLARAGSGGMAATSIGWTLAGCILAGAGAGIWLDKKLGTQYWTPILFLVGVVAGFLAMMRTLNDANRLEAEQRQAERRSRPVVAPPIAERVVTPREAARPSRVPPPPFMEAAPGTAKAGVPEDIDDNLAKIRELLKESREEDETK